LDFFAPFLVEGYEDLSFTQARIKLSLTLASSGVVEREEGRREGKGEGEGEGGDTNIVQEEVYYPGQL
jgi:hypothetical protein